MRQKIIMPKLLKFEEWILETYKTHAAFGEAFGAGQTTVSRWLSGKQTISADYREAIRAAGFKGEFPRAKEEITLQDLESIREEVRTQSAWVREELRKENVALAAMLQEALKRLGPVP